MYIKVLGYLVLKLLIGGILFGLIMRTPNPEVNEGVSAALQNPSGLTKTRTGLTRRLQNHTDRPIKTKGTKSTLQRQHKCGNKTHPHPPRHTHTHKHTEKDTHTHTEKATHRHTHTHSLIVEPPHTQEHTKHKQPTKDTKTHK